MVTGPGEIDEISAAILGEAHAVAALFGETTETAADQSEAGDTGISSIATRPSISTVSPTSRRVPGSIRPSVEPVVVAPANDIIFFI